MMDQKIKLIKLHAEAALKHLDNVDVNPGTSQRNLDVAVLLLEKIKNL